MALRSSFYGKKKKKEIELILEGVKVLFKRIGLGIKQATS